MKFTQKLDYSRLAEVLAEREMADLSAIQELLKASNEGGQPFPEALVTANLVPDWDLSRVVCEVFHLPFLPVDQAQPDKELLKLFHPHVLHNTGLVPISRYGNVLTIAMPGLVAADTLALLSAECDMILLPIVGTVNTNRRWLTENCKQKKFAEDSTWGSLFDEADKAVQETLNPGSDEAADFFAMGSLESEGPTQGASLDLEASSLDFESGGGSLLDEAPSLAETGFELEDLGSELNLEAGVIHDGEDSDESDLPPMPDFRP
ncbi:MAG: hypothetical protein H6827_06835 [Planctomycetes bacterium]|nr:hypothetical protein [Planctomycetota bacterium]HPF14491.1 hypothetical protein [Planctomycetota bacterium]